MSVYCHEGVTGSHILFEFVLTWELDKYIKHWKTVITGIRKQASQDRGSWEKGSKQVVTCNYLSFQPSSNSRSCHRLGEAKHAPKFSQDCGDSDWKLERPQWLKVVG